MKICNRGLNFVQILGNGDVRICAWNFDNVIGNLLEEDFYDIYHGEKANKLRESLICGSYSYCQVDRCPFLANGTIKDELVELDEIPEYPDEIYLAYDRTCNYNCTCCYNCKETPEEYKNNIEIIEKKLEPVLKKVRKIGANGDGELFASPHILKTLHDWKPEAPAEEISVSLETNGSLFTPKNWEKISNLGQYQLKVNITIFSFEESTYQFLSGTKLPISNLENNLRFVKELREQGIINELELATVMQEYNFREIPELVRRCIEEFGADQVRIRPYLQWGVQDHAMEWFYDVRNPYHPYNKEYQRVMQDPIFKHPKAWKWGNDFPSDSGIHPFYRMEGTANIYEKMLMMDNFAERLKNYITNKTSGQMAIYGLSRVGKTLIHMGFTPDIIIDKYTQETCYEGIDVIRPEKQEEKKIGYILIGLSYYTDLLKEKMERTYGLEEGQVEYISDVLEKL